LGLEPRRYFVASLHRAENVDLPAHLTALVETLEAVAARHGLPVVVSTHPRTRNSLERLAPAAGEQVRFLEPFGFHDYVRLQQDACCTLSDSGTISEESAILGFPAVTLRNAMERPEAMDTGNMILTGRDPDTILQAVELAIAAGTSAAATPIPAEYQVTNTSYRVLKLILGTAKLSHLWDGIVAA
jgi:UDP-N-acetylglucosamine 2-epimerase (non-hydrolysing)